MTKVLVTGATGFLGKALCLSLIDKGYEVFGTYRSSYPTEFEYQKVKWIKIPDLSPTEVWDIPLENCELVIHAAARVQQMQTTEKEFHTDNVLGTKCLVDAILRNKGIKQFIFISTIGVYGKPEKMPININQKCIPNTNYAKSKLDAEKLIKNLFQNTSTTWTIFRPTFIYGNDHKGNFAILEKFILKGIPLPVKWLKNKRSFLSIQNMCQYVISSLLNNNAQNRTYCVADPEPISTENLVLKIGKSLNVKPKIIWVPFFVQYILALICETIKIFGIALPWSRDTLTKISGNFWVDMKAPIKELNVTNTISAEQQ